MNLPRRILKPNRGAAVAALLLLALAPALYFYPATLGGVVLCPDDGVAQNLPLRLAAAEIILGGHLPLWNPYIFGGTPLLGSAQGGVLFPLNWFFLLLPARSAMNLSVMSAYSAAGVGAYLYARRAGASLAGAAVTGLVWQWSGFLVSHVGHTNMLQAASLLPWVLWAVDGYGQTGRRRRGATLALVVALQAFAGHPQVLAYTLLLACSYAAARAYASPECRRAYLLSVALALAGLLLAAVQLLPTRELSGRSARASLTYDYFSAYSLQPKLVSFFVAPFVRGGGDGHVFGVPYFGPPHYAEFAGYVGLLALGLAVTATLVWRDALTKFWAAAALACLALALGRHLPFGLYELVHQLPVLNLFRAPARHLMEVDFALAVLAGRAVTALSAERLSERARRAAPAVGACLLLLTLAAVTILRPSGFGRAADAEVGLLRRPELYVPVLMAGAGAFALWLLARWRVKALPLVVALVAFDLWLWGNATGWRQVSAADGPTWNELPAATLLSARGDDGRFRILTLARPFDPDASPAVGPASPQFVPHVQPNAYLRHGVENAAGYDALFAERYRRLACDMGERGEPADAERCLSIGRDFDLLNVRYLVSTRPDPAATPRADEPHAERPRPEWQTAAPRRWKLAAELPDALIYENLRALPRAWLAREVSVQTDDAQLSIIRTGSFADGVAWEPLRTALVEKQVAGLAGVGAEGRAEVTRHEPNRVEVKTAAGGPALLVLSENFYPGWEATVDGRGAEVLRANYNLRGVVVPAGEHSVVFSYRPRSVLYGLLISLAAAAALLGWAALPSGQRTGTSRTTTMRTATVRIEPTLTKSRKR